MNGSLDLVTGDSIFSGQEQHLVDALQYLLNKKGISKNGGNLPRKINIEALKELNISEDNKLSVGETNAFTRIYTDIRTEL